MTVCREKRITRIYIPIWVAFNETKYSPALFEATVFHVFIFYVPQNVLRLCTGLFHLLYADWTERKQSKPHFKRGCENGLNEIPNHCSLFTAELQVMLHIFLNK